MAREAREKKVFGTYYIKQISALGSRLFSNDDDRDKLFEILKNAKKNFNFKVYAYNFAANDYYDLILYDNGSDISSIMKSINISYSMYKKTQEKLFNDRFISKIIDNDFDLAKQIKIIHNANETSIWNSCYEYFKENSSNNLLDNKILKKVFNYHNFKSLIEYKEYFNKNISKENLLCDQNITICERPDKCIKNLKDAKEKLNSLLKEKNYTYNEFLKNKKERDYLIKYFRRNSLLTLKEIGSLFGGLSESTICKIISNQ